MLTLVKTSISVGKFSWTGFDFCGEVENVRNVLIILPFFSCWSIIVFNPLGWNREGGETMDNYILLGLDRKEVKIMNVKKENGIIRVNLESSKKKVRCPECNKFTSSIHDVRKPV